MAVILGVSEKTILTGELKSGTKDVGNMKQTRFYVCPVCGSIMHGTGNCEAVCCGKPLEIIIPKEADDRHLINISEIDDDYYIEFNHEMTKDHYIGFVSYVRFDRVLTIRLYPEQDSGISFPKIYGGKLYYYCSKHGLFEYNMKSRRKT